MQSRYLLGQLIFQDYPSLPTGMYYRYQAQEHLVMLVSPYAASISFRHKILSEPIEFAFGVDSGILFFLAKFGCYQWRNAPYYWHAVPEQERSLPPQHNKEEELKILLIDNLIGAIQGIRTVRLKSHFVSALHREILNQSLLPKMDIGQYRKIKSQIKKRYPSAKEMLSMSVSYMIEPAREISPQKTVELSIDS